MGAEGFIHFTTKTCPICGKEFMPAPEHAWKIGSGKKTRNNLTRDEHKRTYPMVCSYSCMRKWEIEHYGPRKRRKYDYEPNRRK